MNSTLARLPLFFIPFVLAFTTITSLINVAAANRRARKAERLVAYFLDTAYKWRETCDIWKDTAHKWEAVATQANEQVAELLRAQKEQEPK